MIIYFIMIIDIIIIIHLLINENYNLYKCYSALFILMSFLGLSNIIYKINCNI